MAPRLDRLMEDGHTSMSTSPDDLSTSKFQGILIAEVKHLGFPRDLNQANSAYSNST